MIAAMGLAMPFPAISGAEPCMGSNMLTPSGFIFPLAPSPRPPWSCAPRSVSMSPNRFGTATVPYLSGRVIIAMAIASTNMKSMSMSCSLAFCLKISLWNPYIPVQTLALSTRVTLSCPRDSACLKEYSANLSTPFLERRPSSTAKSSSALASRCRDIFSSYILREAESSRSPPEDTLPPIPM